VTLFTSFCKNSTDVKTIFFCIQKLVSNIILYPTQHQLNAMAYKVKICPYFNLQCIIWMLDWCQYKQKVLLLYASYLNLNLEWGSIFLCKYFAQVSLKRRLSCIGHNNKLSWAEWQWCLGFGFSCLFLGFMVFSGVLWFWRFFWGALFVRWWQLLGKWLLHMAMLFLRSNEKLQH